MKRICLFLVCAGASFCLVALSVPALVAIVLGAILYHFAQTPSKKGRKATPPPRDPIDIELDKMKGKLGLTYMKKKNKKG